MAERNTIQENTATQIIEKNDDTAANIADTRLGNSNVSVNQSLSSECVFSGKGSQPRILLIAASNKILGGHSVQARTLLDKLSSNGVDVSFLPIDPDFPAGMNWIRKFPVFRTVINQLAYVISLIRIRHVQIVHVFSASYWSFLLGPVPAILFSRLLGKTVVLHYHSGEAQDHLDNWGILVHPWLRLATEIVVPSIYLKSIFSSHHYDVTVIKNVIDTELFRYRQRYPLRPRILSTRNFEKHYRVDVTLKAFGLLRQYYPDAKLTLAGSGSEESKLRKLALSIAPESIEFVGKVDPNQMPALYDQSDIFVNSSIVDNQPVSILEAFAAGLPVVSTPTGDIPFMVRDGETGLTVSEDDPESLMNAIKALLENPRKATDMAAQASEEVKRFEWQAIWNAWRTLYCQLGTTSRQVENIS